MREDVLDVPFGINKTGLKVPVTIQGIGFAVPKKIVTNEAASENLDTTDEWIQNKTGIKERRYLEEGYLTSDLCIEACQEALLNADIRAEDVDVIILTTTLPDQRLPSTAMVIKESLGATKAIPIDLNQAACAGGIFSMLIGSHFLQNDGIHNVLVIGAEVLSRSLNHTDRSTKVFFGDAAGAIVLQKTSEGSGLLAWDIDTSINNAVQITGGGSKPLADGETLESSLQIKMDGREVWNVATKAIPSSIRKVVESAGLVVEDVDHFLLHQANMNIVKAALKDLQVPLEKSTFTIQDFANTGSASLFSVFYKAMNEKKIKENDFIVFSAIGAGFLWGSLCFKYKKNGEMGNLS